MTLSILKFPLAAFADGNLKPHQHTVPVGGRTQLDPMPAIVLLMAIALMFIFFWTLPYFKKADRKKKRNSDRPKIVRIKMHGSKKRKK